jgi:hypothetical protein
MTEKNYYRHRGIENNEIIACLPAIASHSFKSFRKCPYFLPFDGGGSKAGVKNNGLFNLILFPLPLIPYRQGRGNGDSVKKQNDNSS